MTSEKNASKLLHITLWIAQGVLAVTFILGGLVKLFQPGMLPFPWVQEHAGLVFFTGLVDVLAGIGLVLPTWLGIRPKVTVYTACGAILLMVAAGIFHISRGEAKDIGFNIFVALLAAFVAWGRQKNQIDLTQP